MRPSTLHIPIRPEVEVDAKGGLRVDLGDAGFAMLTLNVNLSTLNDEDRAFVLDALERFVQRSGTDR